MSYDHNDFKLMLNTHSNHTCFEMPTKQRG